MPFMSQHIRAVWLAVCLIAQARGQYRFDAWTADNGLPQNVIRDVCQTRDGYLWVATLNGLARFDGVRFTVFDRINSPGIESNRFTSLFQDIDGDLWLGTESSGVTHYHRGVFTTYTTIQGLPYNAVSGTTGDASGHLWVLSHDRIMVWKPGSARFVDVTPKDLPKIPFEPYHWEGGGFWAADKTSLHCFDGGGFVTYRIPAWMQGHNVWGVAREPNGALWVETLDGMKARVTGGELEPAPRELSIAYVDARRNSWTIGIGPELGRYMIDSSSGSPRKIAFNALREDSEGNLWLATEGQGLYRVRRNFINSYSQEQGLADRDVYPIYQDRAGAVWIGAWHQGVSRFEDGKFTNYGVKDGLASALVTSFAEDRQGRLWIASHAGLNVFEDGRFRAGAGPSIPTHATIEAIHGQPDGTLWFGTSEGLVRYQDRVSKLFTFEDGLAGDDVRVIVDGAAGEMWIGGYHGLTRLLHGEFRHWTENEGLPSNTIRAIYPDRDGAVWIGTYDAGLARFKDGRFARYTTHEGLFDNGVFQILEDSRGNLWMSCNRGIYRVRKAELNEFAAGKRTAIESVAYGRGDGMLNVECNGGTSPAGAKTRDGKLWFPTQDGVAVIDPDAIPSNRRRPPVVIESVLLNHSPASLEGALRITPDKTDFEIQYTALSFIDSEQIRFKYMLENLDTDWVDAGARRTAYYPHVPPGDYVFRVIARNSDGAWNMEGSSLPMTVLAPFYKTWWFELLSVFCAAALVWAAWRYRVAQLEREQAVQQAFSRQLIASQENERKRIAAELHDSLGQRLVVIKNLALFFLRAQGRQDPGGKLAQIEEISAETSVAINETREIAYNLRPFQLDRLGLTKAIEGIVRSVSAASGVRFSSELDNIDDVFEEELRINFYRIVQECLNNVVKHSGASEAGIRIKRDGRHMVLTVDDNGCGLTPGNGAGSTARNGFGLTGLAERARLLGGELAIHSAPGRGTTVRLEISRL
jgi:ligand-binding sensor domain-containing protein/signal transduction histidine kinase